MRFIVSIAFVLIIAVTAGLFVYQDPGYVFISYKTWGIEMPLWLAVVLGFFTFVILFILIKLLNLLLSIPTRMSHWRTKKDWYHAKTNSNLSLLAICNEDWHLVQKYANKAIKSHDQFLMNYVLACFGAFQRKDEEQLSQFLHLAQKNIPDARVFVSLMRAFIQWREGHIEIAKNILLETYSHFSSKKLVVRWLYQVSLILNDWHTLEKILPTIEDMHVLDKENLRVLQTGVYVHRLENLIEQPQSNLDEFWKTVPRALKKENRLVIRYIQALNQHQQHELAWELLAHQLKSNWNSDVIALISQINLSDSSYQLTIAEKWLRTHENDALLLYQLGKLCMRLNLWGKARDYFEKAIKINPSIESYLALAQLHESLHETEKALTCYRLALEI